MVHHRRDEMIIGSPAQERGVGFRGGIAAGEPAQFPQKLRFRIKPWGKVQWPVEPDRGGDPGKELLHRGHPDRLQHLPDIPGRYGE